jgi:hypothetical protein
MMNHIAVGAGSHSVVMATSLRPPPPNTRKENRITTARNVAANMAHRCVNSPIGIPEIHAAGKKDSRKSPSSRFGTVM